MQVSIITSLNYRAHHTTYPLWVYRKQLEEKGVRLRFFYGLDVNAIAQSDVVCIVQWNFKRFFPPYGRHDLDDLLEQFRRKGCRILWIDDQDSSGTIRKDILQKVNIYAKNQLLRERDLYGQPMYQGVYFRDYYHKVLRLEDPGGKVVQGIPEEERTKLRLSWNLSFLNWRVMGKRRLARVIGYLYPRRSFRPRFVHTRLVDRRFDISYRVSDHGHAPTVSYQRQRTIELLRQIELEHAYQILYGAKVSYSEYRSEMANCRIVPSPFGWGEVCFRDFECFEAGAILLKPSMEHLETWPDYYVPNVTYVPFAWDFSDFILKIIELLENPCRYQSIAAEGQKRLFQNTVLGAHGFVEHFLNLIRDVTE